MKFEAIRAQRMECNVAWMCRRLQISRSGYYGWLERKPSRHERDDQRLSVKIIASFRATVEFTEVLVLSTSSARRVSLLAVDAWLA